MSEISHEKFDVDFVVFSEVGQRQEQSKRGTVPKREAAPSMSIQASLLRLLFRTTVIIFRDPVGTMRRRPCCQSRESDLFLVEEMTCRRT